VLRAADAQGGAESGGTITVDAAPDDAWLGGYRQDGGVLPPPARAILTNHPQAGFAAVRRDGRTVAIARAAVDDRWAGLFAVEVVPDSRGAGLGRLVSAAALRWGGRRGARRTYLQVSADNSPALALYERLGYAVHHTYVYRARG
jgi:GNAT superfamily N-acetyltransferase